MLRLCSNLRSFSNGGDLERPLRLRKWKSLAKFHNVRTYLHLECQHEMSRNLGRGSGIDLVAWHGGTIHVVPSEFGELV